MNRRQYTNEFKSEAVRLARSGDKTITQTAKDLGINDGLLHKWMKVYGTDSDRCGKPSPDEHEEFIRLRKELRRVTEERDILKKAVAYFAKEQL